MADIISKPKEWLFKTKPMTHQLQALEACGGREYYAYFMEPGLGKTKVVIDEVQSLYPAIDTVVVICPKSITTVWVEEIETHGVMGSVGVWDGNGFQWGTVGKVQYYIINIDAVNRTKTSHKGFDFVHGVLKLRPNSMVVVDESTIIKNPDSKRTKAVTDLGALAKYRRILTGTPIANTPLDIYAQMRFLHPTEIFKWNYYAFRARYAVMGGFQMRQVVGYKNQDQMAQIVSRHSFRATKADCLDLPPRTTQVRWVTLTDTTWKAYCALVDELAVEFAGTQMPIDMAIKKMVKLRQLTGGWLRDDDGNAHPVGHEKLDELAHLLDECRGQKIIVWCQFTHEVLGLQKLHPLARVFHGGMSMKARDEARHEFEHGTCPLIIVQNDTGSVGLTLNAASVSVFYTNPTYPLLKDQARDRNYRKGQDKPVTEYELVVKGSIDETIYNALINKRSLADLMMEMVGGEDRREALKKFIAPMRTVNWKAPKVKRAGD